MLKIGLTGGIGSGKSTVAQIFQMLGIPVFDADSASKKIMETDVDLMNAIKAQFGEAIYVDGKLQRKVLADIVFNDAHKLDLLNAIVHPATIKAAEQWFADQQTSYVIKEAALLFEAGTTHNLNFVIGVQAPIALRIQRCMQRDGVSREEVQARMSRQIDDRIKMKLCDFVIVNDEQHLLTEQVLKLHQHFLSLNA
jgi:dephospho-CoA kinase